MQAEHTHTQKNAKKHKTANNNNKEKKQICTAITEIVYDVIATTFHNRQPRKEIRARVREREIEKICCAN